MKMYKYVILCAGLLLLFSGPSKAYEIDLVQSGCVSVETIYSEELLFQSVKVMYDFNTLRIEGYVALRKITILGHFEISIVSPENVVLDRINTEDRYYNKRRNRPIKFFSVETQVNPPIGTRIVVMFKEKPLGKE